MRGPQENNTKDTVIPGPRGDPCSEASPLWLNWWTVYTLVELFLSINLSCPLSNRLFPSIYGGKPWRFYQPTTRIPNFHCRRNAWRMYCSVNQNRSHTIRQQRTIALIVSGPVGDPHSLGTALSPSHSTVHSPVVHTSTVHCPLALLIPARVWRFPVCILTTAPFGRTQPPSTSALAWGG